MHPYWAQYEEEVLSNFKKVFSTYIEVPLVDNIMFNFLQIDRSGSHVWSRKQNKSRLDSDVTIVDYVI